MISHCIFNFANQFSSFVDRDMFMRYLGGGVGHCAAQQRDRVDAEQADAMDIDVQTEEGFELDEDGPLAQQGCTSDEDEEDYEDGEMEVDDSDLDEDEDEDFGPEDGEDDDEAEEEYYGDL